LIGGLALLRVRGQLKHAKVLQKSGRKLMEGKFTQYFHSPHREWLYPENLFARPALFTSGKLYSIK